MIERLLVGIFEFCVEILGYYTARLVMPLISLGRIHLAPAQFSRPFATWGEPLLKRLPNGTIIVKHSIGSVLGVLIWVVAIMLYALLWR